MPIYRFHVEGVPEPTTEELDTLAEVKCEAVRYAGQLICDSPGEFWDTKEFKMTVSDEAGLTLFILELSEVEAPALRGR